MFSSKSKLALCFLSLLSIFLLTACNQSADASSPGTYAVDQVFLDFYKGIGGDETLGPAISPPFTKEGITYQYVVSGLMVYDPNQVPLKRFHFSAIASVEWKINDLVEPAPDNPILPYVNGHRIWEEVWPFYQRFGSDIIGLPVTGVKANDNKQRYEQYFEGVGFYRKYSDPAGQIQLMPYGAWMCGENCLYQASDKITPSPSFHRDYSETEQLFLQESDRLGYGLTGSPLIPAYKAEDGNFELVFENAILYIDAASGNQIKLRPLPAWMGIQPDELTTEIKLDWLTFYPVKETLGYNIPNLFAEYIVEHGGYSISGVPITEYRQLSDGGYTQCFTNLCLEYHPTAPADLRIHPHALGSEYLANGANIWTPDTSLSKALQINVWEEFPLIASGQRQVILVEATQNDAPVKGVELSLVVKQPDGITKTYKVNPTGEKGRTSIELDTINGPNGAIVQYEVCVLGAVSPQICFSRSYTIWDQ